MDAISRATDVPDSFAGYPGGLRAIQLPEPGVSSYFLTLFGRSDRVTACACERSGDITMAQLLHMVNGEAVAGKVGAPDGRLADLLKSKKPEAEVVEDLFLAALSRLPTAAELTVLRRS